MKTQIFIRTYFGDIQWLSYCLRSINKFASGFEGITIVCPADEMELICPVCEACNTSLPLPAKDDLPDQYISQQITKIYADTYIPVDTDVIMYLDSDCFLTAHITPETFMVDGKIRLIRESFERMKGDQSYVWKGLVEKALGIENAEYEYMRCHPFLHYPETLQRVRKWFIDQHNLPVEHYARLQPYHQFTEFNLIGTVAQTALGDRYHAHTLPQDGYFPAILSQGWSWGGLDPIRKQWMEDILNDRIAA